MSSNIEYLETRRKNIRKVIIELIIAVCVLDAVLLIALAWSCYG